MKEHYAQLLVGVPDRAGDWYSIPTFSHNPQQEPHAYTM
jgi:hypothetical protein